MPDSTLPRRLRLLIGVGVLLVLALLNLPVQAATAVFINEIHYDNVGDDADEAIEIAGPAGLDLTGWRIFRYNGSGGAVYPAGSTGEPLGVLSDLGNGFGVFVVAYPKDGLQNGEPDGIALVDNNDNVVQFLSYEGTFTAINGPAAGLTSTDIGVGESGSTPVGYSLQLSGAGASYEDFVWSVAAPNTFGQVNSGQSYTGGSVGPADPVINEFVFNHVSTDDHEFVEIYGDAGHDYSAFTLLEIEGDSPSTGTIDEVITLGTTDADGFWATDFLNNAFENGTLTLLLVEGFSGSLNADLDTDDNGVLDITPWTRIVDAVAIHDGGGSDLTYAGPVLAANYDGDDFTPGGASRFPDGKDTDAASDWVRNDFDGAGLPGFAGTPDFGEAFNTPGAANQRVPEPLPSIVINELDADTAGTDTLEFVELYDGGAGNTSLDGLVVVFYNGSNDLSYAAFDLDGYATDANGYFVLGNAAVSPAPSLVFNNDTLQNGQDAVALYKVDVAFPNGTAVQTNGLIDAIVYDTSDADDPGLLVLLNAGQPQVDENSNGAGDSQSSQRCPNGEGGQRNTSTYTQAAPSPGAANNCGAATPSVSITAIDANAAETGQDTGVFRISRSGDTGSTLTVNYTINGSSTAANDGSDYTPILNGTVTLEIGMASVDIVITPVDDAVEEGDEILSLSLAGGSGYNLGSPATATVIIADNDGSYVACSADDMLISLVQGSGNVSPVDGQIVTVQGIVVGDYEGPSPTLRGFYLQEENADQDGDPATSEGIFVFNGDTNSVGVGQIVQVTGTVADFQDQTQLSNVQRIEICEGAGTVTPVTLTLPFPEPENGVHYLERFEGMLVELPQTLYVTEHFQLGRFGQVVLSAEERLYQPTHVAEPGPAAAAVQAANDLNRIILDDHLNNQNPDPVLFARGGQPLSADNTLRGGDTVSGIVGVLTYTWSGNSASGNAYRIRPINALGGGAPNFQPANPRPALPDDVGGQLKVAAFNVLNYFTTLGDRGAETPQEFERQQAKIVAALAAINADVVGLIEIENNGDTAVQNLVAALNAQVGAGVYSFIATGVVGTDAIKVALIYKPASVTPVGAYEILDSSVDPRFIDTRNRPALAQTFAEGADGPRFTVVVNHLKSKGSDCGGAPDDDPQQGNCNLTRTQAAKALVDWLATDPTGSGTSAALIIGDLNAYALEDPITAIRQGADDTTGTADDWVDLAATLIGQDAYSYVFDGGWGYLDHALASSSLAAQVTGVTEWHINADEPNVLDYNTNFKSEGQITSFYNPDPFRSADHDPIIIGLAWDMPPANDFLGACVFAANDDVTIHRDAVIHCTVGSMGQINIDRDGVIQGDILAGDNVTLDRGIRVEGDVEAGGLITLAREVVVTGAVNPSLDPSPVDGSNLLPDFGIGANGGDIRIDRNEHRTLAPGVYGSLDVRQNAVVTFAPGHYTFKEIRVQKDTALIFSGLTVIDVERDVQFQSGVEMTGVAEQIVFRMGKGLEVHKDGRVQGIFLAPTGDITLHQNNVVNGLLYGRSVTLHRSVQISGAPLPSLSELPPVHTQGRTTEEAFMPYYAFELYLPALED